MSNDGPVPTKGTARTFVWAYLKLGAKLITRHINVDDITFFMSPGTVLNGGVLFETSNLILGTSGSVNGGIELNSSKSSTNRIRQYNAGSPFGYEWSMPLFMANTAGLPMLSAGSSSYNVPNVWGTTSLSLKYDVLSIANNGSGLLRIETTAAHDFLTNDVVWLEDNPDDADLSGETNRPWKTTFVDTTHVDLQGSTFGSASGATGGHIFHSPNFLIGRDGRTISAGPLGIDSLGLVKELITAGNGGNPTGPTTGGSGANAKIDDQFDGGLGGTKYTIDAIVFALKTAGLINP